MERERDRYESGMEVDEIQTQVCKYSRVGNGRSDRSKIGQRGEQYPDDEDGGEIKRDAGVSGIGGDGGSGTGRFRGWHSSRIFRVSRASGGKDRHSKVLTSKGLRDRRVRLSVTTAIQFYDLQDRLGFDQPSRAVEWLINKAAPSIAELPPLSNPFPDTPKQASDEKRLRRAIDQGLDSVDVDLENDPNFNQHQQHHISLSKSACSSTSETSKGSGLSLSRSEIRVKARERARERAAKEKDKEKETDSHVVHQHNVSPISQTSTFTELLTGGIGSVSNSTTSPSSTAQQNSSTRHWPTPMDYFSTAFNGSSPSRVHHSSGFSGQIHMGNSLPQSMSVSPFSITGDHHPDMQPFSFTSDHLIPVASTADYNLNFTISSGLNGFNRGTLQSNSPSFLPHLQRFSPVDGSNIPFFIGTAAASAAPMENHHQFPNGFDGRLQLCYGNGSRHSDQKGKGKN